MLHVFTFLYFHTCILVRLQLHMHRHFQPHTFRHSHFYIDMYIYMHIVYCFTYSFFSQCISFWLTYLFICSLLRFNLMIELAIFQKASIFVHLILISYFQCLAMFCFSNFLDYFVQKLNHMFRFLRKRKQLVQPTWIIIAGVSSPR